MLEVRKCQTRISLLLKHCWLCSLMHSKSIKEATVSHLWAMICCEFALVALSLTPLLVVAAVVSLLRRRCHYYGLKGKNRRAGWCSYCCPFLRCPGPSRAFCARSAGEDDQWHMPPSLRPPLHCNSAEGRNSRSLLPKLSAKEIRQRVESPQSRMQRAQGQGRMFFHHVVVWRT